MLQFPKTFHIPNTSHSSMGCQQSIVFNVRKKFCLVLFHFIYFVTFCHSLSFVCFFLVLITIPVCLFQFCFHFFCNLYFHFPKKTQPSIYIFSQTTVSQSFINLTFVFCIQFQQQFCFVLLLLLLSMCVFVSVCVCVCMTSLNFCSVGTHSFIHSLFFKGIIILLLLLYFLVLLFKFLFLVNCFMLLFHFRKQKETNKFSDFSFESCNKNLKKRNFRFYFFLF